jgi:hypothetical protein
MAIGTKVQHVAPPHKPGNRKNEPQQTPSPLKRNSTPRSLLHKAIVKQEQNQIADPAEGCILKEGQYKPKQGH